MKRQFDLRLHHIVGAAARDPTSRTLFIGRRHADVMRDMVLTYGFDHIEQDWQGFWTSKNQFVNRKKAALIAHQAGQIPQAKDTLFSEDLW